jgi:hypothetical protein
MQEWSLDVGPKKGALMVSCQGSLLGVEAIRARRVRVLMASTPAKIIAQHFRTQLFAKKQNLLSTAMTNANTRYDW